MTQAEKIQAIMADTKSSLPQKVIHYILSSTIDQLGALTTEKLATIFNTPFITLDIQFKKETKKSFAEFLHFQKMLAVHSLMWQQREKPWSALEISKKIGYKEYPDFVTDFEAQFLIHPQRYLEILSEINKNQQSEMKQISPHPFIRKLQYLPSMKSQEAIGPVLIKYCRAIATYFKIDHCGILIPQGNILLKGVFSKASLKNHGAFFKNIEIPADYLPWQRTEGKDNTGNKQDTIDIEGISEDHPYYTRINDLFNCPLQSITIIPILLCDIVTGYILIVQEQVPRLFTVEETGLLEEISADITGKLNKLIHLEEINLVKKFISIISAYKKDILEGGKKDLDIFLKVFHQARIEVRWIYLINKDHNLGNKWVHLETNASGDPKINERGNFSENDFQYFLEELVINSPDSIAVPIKKGNDSVGKLIIKYTPRGNDDMIKDSMYRVLREIALPLAELMYL